MYFDTRKGEIIIVGPENGNNLRVNKRNASEDENRIWDISADAVIFVVAWESKLEIWKIPNGES